MRFRFLASILLSFILCFVIFPSQLAHAATTWTVTSLADNTSGTCNPTASTSTTLRAAIAAVSAGDTIQFQSGLIGKITLTSGTLTIGKNLIISGAGA